MSRRINISVAVEVATDGGCHPLSLTGTASTAQRPLLLLRQRLEPLAQALATISGATSITSMRVPVWGCWKTCTTSRQSAP